MKFPFRFYRLQGNKKAKKLPHVSQEVKWLDTSCSTKYSVIILEIHIQCVF